MMEEGVDVEAFYVCVNSTLIGESRSTVPRGPPRLTYLFIGGTNTRYLLVGQILSTIVSQSAMYLEVHLGTINRPYQEK